MTAIVTGQIAFEFPGVLSGRLIRDLRLVWKAGQLVQAFKRTRPLFRALNDTEAGR